MRRKYKDRVEFWGSTATADGYGGRTHVDALISASWANVTTIPTQKLTQVGLDVEQLGILVKVRTRSDIDYHQQGLFIKYKSKTFTITSITEVDLDGRELEIIATYA